MDEVGNTLDISAFKHVVVPLGVVIGLGVARIVLSVSQYIERRDQVRASWIHALWTTLLFLLFVGLWWVVWGFRHAEAERWSFFALIYLLAGPVLVYLPTLLLLPNVPETGQIDLGGLFDRFGRPVFLCLSGFAVWVALAELYLLQEPFWVPKRLNQAALLTAFGVGAIFPSRRVAGAIGGVALLLVVLALATLRSRLA